jgi:aspartate racemase
LEREGIEYAVPDGACQEKLTRIIYDFVKRGLRSDPALLYEAVRPLQAAGCDCMILGCTELSVAAREIPEEEMFIDSLQVLACRAITMCGSETQGFREEFALMDPEMQI